ncbi:hypothetical protein K2224_14345 [Streptomyces sp. BHT-5-2]|uniref:hypothetical protein n=1 Tax=Streptomyces sp. BHT-5-2 TaxID=2866715 RepID=UPI001C8D897E|nr:hypothetical protein [Streptomyces sp. BHT-5-2]QZL04229.1 hypothetical protein K2224_14345 [Streptomyces sp. BHT-5-2]
MTVVRLLFTVVAVVCATLAMAHPSTTVFWQVVSQVITAAGGLAGLAGVALTIDSLRRRESRQ